VRLFASVSPSVGARFIAPALPETPPPRRKPLRLHHADYAHAGFYFVTICTHARACLFGEVLDHAVSLGPIGQIVRRAWMDLPARIEGMAVDEFVVMPNHVHGIVVLSGDRAGAMNRAPTLGEVVRRFKARCSVEYRKLSGTAGPLWQRNYYEHVVRSDADLTRVSEYIADNPRRWDEDDENPQRLRG